MEIAQNDRDLEMRKKAMFWLGQKNVATVSCFPRCSPNEAPVIQPPLKTMQHAIQWLGLLGDTSARRVLHAIIEDDSEAMRTRTHAIFSLAHGGDTPEPEFAYLRTLYPRLAGLDLKESVIQGMHQDEGTGGRWLIERALALPGATRGTTAGGVAREG